MVSMESGNQQIDRIVKIVMYFQNNPMSCNMFEKKCSLLTCNIKGSCLWSKGEVERLKNTTIKYGDTATGNSI